MTREQRIRTCQSLMQLMLISKSKRISRIYHRQLERCVSRLQKQKEQPSQRTTA